MRTTGGQRRTTRALGFGLLIGSLTLGLAATATANETADSADSPTATATTTTPSPSPSETGAPDGGTGGPEGDGKAKPQVLAALAPASPYGPGFPITQETNFARPTKALSASGADFSQLDDLERLIRGTYMDPRTGKLLPDAARHANNIRMSMSRMENSKRVARELIRAARYHVPVIFVHGKEAQSAASRSLQKQLNATPFGKFVLCSKGKSLACLSTVSGGIIHTKSLIIESTFTRDNIPAKGAVWFGSANIGGPSGENTWNNGLTVYNDKKLYYQAYAMFSDLMAERNVGNNYPGYIKSFNSKYGYPGAYGDGYFATKPLTGSPASDYSPRGMFYSNLSNLTIYASPIAATPTNGLDPIMAALNRIVPDSTCKIRVQENRWKYRRLAIAEKLVELSDRGCQVSVVAYQDDLLVNRIAHCQIYIRVCRPILDELRTAKVHIGAAYAKPHDKIILIEGKMMKSALNLDERKPDGSAWASGAANAIPVTMVQAGSAALTGSNLVASDEVTTESLDPQVFADYLEHWRGINKSREFRNYPY